MPKYVELSAVQQKIMKMIGDIRGTYLAKDIGEMSPADVQEVRHAKWMTDRFGMERSICSNCGAVYDGGDSFRFCPKCGAKMDLEEKENETLD